MSRTDPVIAFRKLPGDIGDTPPPVTARLSLGATGGRIAIPEAVGLGIERHLRTSDHEQGGLLLGDVFALPDAGEDYPFLTLVREAVPAPALESGPDSLVMEAAVWDRARRALDAGRRVLGWYHSHPGLGVFFSSADRRTQRSFFPAPHSLGLVVDWKQRLAGLFVGPDAISYRPEGTSPLAALGYLPIGPQKQPQESPVEPEDRKERRPRGPQTGP